MVSSQAHLTRLVFLPQELFPGTILILQEEIVLPPKKSLHRRQYFTRSTGTLGVGLMRDRLTFMSAGQVSFLYLEHFRCFEFFTGAHLFSDNMYYTSSQFFSVYFCVHPCALCVSRCCEGRWSRRGPPPPEQCCS